MALIQIENVHKRYGDPQHGYLALRGLTCSIAAGEFIALRGPSGCGKSTLLHLLGAMDRPTEGRIVLGAQELGRLTDDQLTRVRRREVGFVFQAYNLLPTLTAWENVALPLALDGRGEGAARQQAMHCLADLGLGGKADAFPSELSGGEVQRVAIARALALEPTVIIADEPTGSLDRANGLIVLELLRNLHRTRQLTIIMATHDPLAASFASRTLQMQDGRLCTGPAEAAAEADRVEPPILNG